MFEKHELCHVPGWHANPNSVRKSMSVCCKESAHASARTKMMLEEAQQHSPKSVWRAGAFIIDGSFSSPANDSHRIGIARVANIATNCQRGCNDTTTLDAFDQ